MNGAISALLALLQPRLMLLLISCYVGGALLPRAGNLLRAASIGRLKLLGGDLDFSAPMLLLSFLLFSAGTGIRLRNLGSLLRRPQLLVSGLVANTALPVVYAALVARLLRAWPEQDEAESLLMGLALIGAMPIAGASTAWSQNSDGNLALSLGLVLGSTLLAPLTTPLVLRAVALWTSGDYAEDLHLLAAPSTQLFLAAAVAVPSALGMGRARRRTRERRECVTRARIARRHRRKGARRLPTVLVRARARVLRKDQGWRD